MRPTGAAQLLAMLVGNRTASGPISMQAFGPSEFLQLGAHSQESTLSRGRLGLMDFPLPQRRHASWTNSSKASDSKPITFEAAKFSDWFILVMMLLLFVGVYFAIMQKWPLGTRYHMLVVLYWPAGAALHILFNAWVDHRDPTIWTTGYLIELIGSVENVFVFHVIIKAFNMPQSVTQKAILLVICCQVVFQLLLFCGLAQLLQVVWILPFVLGVWLIYCGFRAASEDHGDTKFTNLAVTGMFNHWLGDKFVCTYEKDSLYLESKAGDIQFTMLLPTLTALIVADFCLEIDTTLLKIEELRDDFAGFSSSAFAAFAVPELYFLARDLFQRYPLLRYGIAFALVLFGADMLVDRFFTTPPLLSCCIVLATFICIVGCSSVMELCYSGHGYVCKAPCEDDPGLSQRDAEDAHEDRRDVEAAKASEIDAGRCAPLGAHRTARLSEAETAGKCSAPIPYAGPVSPRQCDRAA